MRLRQVGGTGILPEWARQRLENIVFPSLESARHEVQIFFPRHVVAKEPGRIAVLLRDRSIPIVLFQEVPDSPRGPLRAPRRAP